MKKAVLIIFSSFALSACVHHSQIVPFHPKAAEKTVTSVQPEQVVIYRTRGPFKSFNELGLITYQTPTPYLSSMYEQLREDAGAAGAAAVVDLRVKSETHQETVSEQKCVDEQRCDGNGVCKPEQVCHTEESTHDVTTYFAVGTMINGGIQ